MDRKYKFSQKKKMPGSMNELYKRERCRPYWALSEVRRFWISRSCVNSVRERVCVEYTERMKMQKQRAI
jgi:hypothetical protein